MQHDHGRRAPTIVSLIGLAVLLLLGAACRPSASEQPNREAPSRHQLPADWTLAQLSPDGTWGVYSSPADSFDMLHVVGTSATLDILEQAVPFVRCCSSVDVPCNSSAFSPDSKHFLALVTPDARHPDSYSLVDYQLSTTVMPKKMSPVSGSLRMPGCYVNERWTESGFDFQYPASRYEPLLDIHVDLSQGTFLSIPAE